MTSRNPAGTEDFPSPDCSDVAHGPQRLNTIIGPTKTSWTGSAAPTTSASTSCWNYPPPKPTSAQTSTRAELDDLGWVSASRLVTDRPAPSRRSAR
jgi:hypothetical protein